MTKSRTQSVARIQAGWDQDWSAECSQNQTKAQCVIKVRAYM